jgi:type I restriction enzyme S subunit
MREGWNIFNLGGVVEIKYGKDHKKLGDGNYPLYGSGGVMRYVDSYLYDDESVLIPRKGTLSNLFYLNEPFSTVDTMFWTKVNKSIALPKFLYYLLKTYDLASLDEGAAIPSLTTKALNVVKIPLPPLETQRKIAKILSNYDDLIENNLKRIKILEEMAQQTYEEWFVRMRFPGYETTKINETTGLPEGWERDLVGNQLDKIKSTTKIKSSEIQKSGLFPVIDQSRDFIAGFTDDRVAVLRYSNTPYIVFGDHTRVLKLINFDFARGADGTQIIKSKNKRMLQHLFYFTLMNIDLSNYHYARHFKYLKDSEIIIPSESIANTFEDLVKLNYDIIFNLQSQNQRLREARDILLPRLMMGLVDVEDIDL